MSLKNKVKPLPPSSRQIKNIPKSKKKIEKEKLYSNAIDVIVLREKFAEDPDFINKIKEYLNKDYVINGLTGDSRQIIVIMTK